MRRSDVMSWRPLLGRHQSCAVRSEESIGRDFGAFRVHGNEQTADGTLIFMENTRTIVVLLPEKHRKRLDLDFMEKSRIAMVLWPF